MISQWSEIYTVKQTRGYYTAPEGTEYEALSLPYVRETCEFHKYRVIADNVDVMCIVDKGKVAPMFDYPGCGIQYLHEVTMNESLKNHILDRIGGPMTQFELENNPIPVNIISKKYLKKSEISCLIKTLNMNNISDENISINAYADDCVCISKIGSHWKVFIGSRGHKCEIKRHKFLSNACQDIIKRLSDSYELQINMRKQFISLLNKEKSKLSSSKKSKR